MEDFLWDFSPSNSVVIESPSPYQLWCPPQAASKLVSFSSPHVTEVVTLEWATGSAKDECWSNVEWSCDARNVVKEVTKKSNPSAWETYYELNSIQSRFEKVYCLES
ncbi:hypothetical protein FNV43_RR11164 [Rhamnella rubrinervis]|uniref:Uncharacterized protein n=1 Tax=Rhamnella rubrinervis TaxID=2594499 RepID=A0A8K0MHD4_9ROSA|nr:hypothetical protein FNV43_RR11164 [Rhamnella rubrinervis]